VIKATRTAMTCWACGPLLGWAGAQWLGVTGARRALRCAPCPGGRAFVDVRIGPGSRRGSSSTGLRPWFGSLGHRTAEAVRRPQPAGHEPRGSLEIDTGMARQGVRVVQPNISPDGELASMLLSSHAGSCLWLEGVMTHFWPRRCCPLPFPTPIGEPRGGVELNPGAPACAALVHAGSSSTSSPAPTAQILSRWRPRAGARLCFAPVWRSMVTSIVSPWNGSPGVARGRFEPVLGWEDPGDLVAHLANGRKRRLTATPSSPTRETRLALLPAAMRRVQPFAFQPRARAHRGQQAPNCRPRLDGPDHGDVTGIPAAAVGDEAVLRGTRRPLSFPWDLGSLAGTIPWEWLCAISPRVPRLIFPRSVPGEGERRLSAH